MEADQSWWNTTPVAIQLTSNDITKAAQNAFGSFDTPVQKLKADTRRFYDSVCLPICKDTWKERWQKMCISLQTPALNGEPEDPESNSKKDSECLAEQWRLNPSFEHNEVTMTRLDEAEHVTGLVSDWLTLDSEDDWLRLDSEIALKQELAYAAYLNIRQVVLPPPRERVHAASYGRALRTCLETFPALSISVRLPIYDPSILKPKTPALTPIPGSASVPSSPTITVVTPVKSSARAKQEHFGLSQASSNDFSSTWEMWDVIRTVCDYHPRLSLALDLTPPLPTLPNIFDRWSAEPIHYVFLPSSTFISNPKGYPVLPKVTQLLLQSLMKNRPTIILSSPDVRLHPRGSEGTYVDYVRYLEKTSPHAKRSKEQNTIEHYAQGYQDFLQAPLQPLQDHLGSFVYENFERDPVKYQKYEEAIFHALQDMATDQRIVICVAGAGRGPLVSRALKAIEASDRTAFVYAVEKNPNAFVTLKHRQETEWQSEVELLFGDMRSIQVPEKADILVSELLGSFGDNELSPECLDGAMRFLKDDGISIPASYSAYLAPISSSKLHHEAGGNKDSGLGNREKYLETLYVVYLQSVNVLSGQGGGLSGRCGPRIQECWEFEHPRKEAVLDPNGLPLTNVHNARSAALRFYIPQAGVLHGFAGYFEAVLYGGIGISIHPERKDRISKDMLSWFPCYFPLKEPLYLPGNSELQVSLWRLTGNHKVWYEWYAESFLPTQEARQPYVSMRNGPLASPLLSAPSPMLDAADISFGEDRSMTMDVDIEATESFGVTKIGQSSLHNPGGRSSWYGL